MRLSLRLLLLPAALVLLAGCAGGGRAVSDEVHHVPVDEYNLAPGPQAPVATVEYLVLEQPEGQLLAGTDKVSVEDGRIYVGDYRSQKVFVYSEEGKLLGVLARNGRGPGEYIRMASFSVADGVLYVLDEFESRILAYDAGTLAHLRSLQPPVQVRDFSALRDGGFLLAWAPMEGTHVADPAKRYRVFVTDADLRIREGWFPYAEDEAYALSFRQCLTEAGESLVYGSYREDGYCLFSRADGHPEGRVAFDLAKPVPAAERGSIQAVMEHKYNHMMAVPFLCGDYVSMTLVTGENGIPCLYDRTQDRLMDMSQASAKSSLVGIVGCTADSFVGTLYHKSNYINLTNNGFSRADPETEAAILADAPFLVFYRLNVRD